MKEKVTTSAQAIKLALQWANGEKTWQGKIHGYSDNTAYNTAKELDNLEAIKWAKIASVLQKEREL